MSPPKSRQAAGGQRRGEHLEVLAQDGERGVLPGRVALGHVDGAVRRLLGGLLATFLRK